MTWQLDSFVDITPDKDIGKRKVFIARVVISQDKQQECLSLNFYDGEPNEKEVTILAQQFIDARNEPAPEPELFDQVKDEIVAFVQQAALEGATKEAILSKLSSLKDEAAA